MTEGRSVRKRGRPAGPASEIAAKTGLSIRTVQRAIAGKAKVPETAQEKTLRRFMETLRNFASFCRENRIDDIGAMEVTEQQAAKIREWNRVALPWLQGLSTPNDQPDPN